jgi:hypothetical protein
MQVQAIAIRDRVNLPCRLWESFPWKFPEENQDKLKLGLARTNAFAKPFKREAGAKEARTGAGAAINLNG